MRRGIFGIILLWGYLLNGQDCLPLNQNGNFETRNNLPGISHILGISAGEIDNWHSSHGTADFLDASWNWYDLDNLESRTGHICYGIRDQGIHSEGIFTELQLLSDADLEYNLSFDYSNVCKGNDKGLVHLYLANNIKGGANFNAFKLPTEANYPDWFEGAQKLGTIALNSDSDFINFGMSHFSENFKIKNPFSQLWFFTDYTGDYEGLVNCGFLIDNVNVSCSTDALIGIEAVETTQNRWSFKPQLKQQLNILEYYWDLGNEEYCEEPIATRQFDSGTHKICLDIVDDRKACASTCITIEVKEHSDFASCDYSVCLDASGTPAINDVKLLDVQGQVIQLNEQSGFSFPYCIGSWNMCQSQAFQLDGLISDINAWMSNNNYHGTANKDNNGSVADGCRMSILNIQASELIFQSIEIIDESREGTSFEYAFLSGNCIEAQEKEIIEDAEDTKHEIKGLSFYPQISSGHLIISKSPASKIEKLYVFDLSGNRRAEIELSPVEEKLVNIESYEKGIYIFMYFDGQEIRSQRIIKI